MKLEITENHANGSNEKIRTAALNSPDEMQTLDSTAITDPMNQTRGAAHRYKTNPRSQGQESARWCPFKITK